MTKVLYKKKKTWIEEFETFGDFDLYGNFTTLILGVVRLKRLLWVSEKAYSFKVGGKLKRNKILTYHKNQSIVCRPRNETQTFEP